MELRGKFALVTGASSGIGRAFAAELARRGAGLALVARRGDRLKELADELAGRYGVPVEVIEQDLTAPDAVDRVRAELDRADRQVDILINNAGVGGTGRFVDLTADLVHREVALDVGAVVAIAHAVLPGMVERGWGLVINLASISAFQPTPYMALYGAAKAFVLSFSQALAAESARHGVRVLALCPGPVATEFFDNHAGGGVTSGRRPAVAIGPMRSPEWVVRDALRAAERGRTMISPGLVQLGMVAVNRILPRRVMLAMTERRMRSALGVS